MESYFLPVIGDKWRLEVAGVVTVCPALHRCLQVLARLEKIKIKETGQGCVGPISPSIDLLLHHWGVVFEQLRNCLGQVFLLLFGLGLFIDGLTGQAAPDEIMV